VGADAACALRENGARHPGRALLETDELIFRGTDGYRLKVKLSAVRNVRANDGDLLFDAPAPAGAIALELGDKAARWAARVRSPKGLLDKLDLKNTYAVALIGVWDKTFAKQLSTRVASVSTGRAPKAANVVFLWTETPASLNKLGTLTKTMARDGAIWVIHPKGAASKVKDTDVFAVAKKVGLTAIKVARFSETHTAEKLVIPVAKR
jgi:hypothetical protein